MSDILGRRFTDTLVRWRSGRFARLPSERDFTIVSVDPEQDDCCLYFVDGYREHRFFSNVLRQIEDGELIESEQPPFVLPPTGAPE